jgi:hypothetical protein
MSFCKITEWHFLDSIKKQFFAFSAILEKNSRYLIKTLNR